MNVDVAEGIARGQERHAVARLLRPLSLRTRLSLLVGFIVAVVVGAAAFLELRMFTARMESELIGGARITARAVADDFELRRGRHAQSRAASCTNSSRSIRPFAPLLSSSWKARRRRRS